MAKEKPLTVAEMEMMEKILELCFDKGVIPAKLAHTIGGLYIRLSKLCKQHQRSPTSGGGTEQQQIVLGDDEKTK